MTIEKPSIESRGENYVQLFDAIRGRVGDDQLAIAILEQCGKDFRVAQMRGIDHVDRLDSQGGADMPATPKQVAFLEKLQVRYIPQNLTKDQASKMIDEAQARSHPA